MWLKRNFIALYPLVFCLNLMSFKNSLPYLNCLHLLVFSLPPVKKFTREMEGKFPSNSVFSSFEYLQHPLVALCTQLYIQQIMFIICCAVLHYMLYGHQRHVTYWLLDVRINFVLLYILSIWSP